MTRHLVYRDFDAFAESVTGIDAGMMLQNPRRRLWSIEHAEIAGIQIQRGRLGSGNIVEGQSWSHSYGLYLPLSDGCQYSANGTLFGQESLMILEPGCQFCISTKDEHDWCYIVVPTHLLAANGVSVEPESITPKSLCRVTRPRAAVANTVATLVDGVFNTATTCTDFEASLAAELAARAARAVVSQAVRMPQPQEGTPQGRPRISRQEIIRRCRQVLEEHRRRPIQISNLAAAAEVSERTLETVFKEYFGVCPKRYLLARQLHLVRYALQAADPNAESVTEVLVRYGEWELGRFARRYRELFGEVPSSTLRSRNPRQNPN